MTATLRARPRGAEARPALRVRPDRPDRDRDRRLGDRGRRRRLRLPRRRGRAARRRGCASGAICSGSRARARSSTRSTPGVTARPDPRQRAAPLRALPRGGADGRRGRPDRFADRRASRELVDLHERMSLPAAAGEGRVRSRSTPSDSPRTRPARRSPRRRRRPACRPTTPSGSAPGSSSTLSSAVLRRGIAQTRGLICRQERHVADLCGPGVRLRGPRS